MRIGLKTRDWITQGEIWQYLEKDETVPAKIANIDIYGFLSKHVKLILEIKM